MSELELIVVLDTVDEAMRVVSVALEDPTARVKPVTKSALMDKSCFAPVESSTLTVNCSTFWDLTSTVELPLVS